jgi:hypothetical protein
VYPVVASQNLHKILIAGEKASPRLGLCCDAPRNSNCNKSAQTAETKDNTHYSLQAAGSKMAPTQLAAGHHLVVVTSWFHLIPSIRHRERRDDAREPETWNHDGPESQKHFPICVTSNLVAFFSQGPKRKGLGRVYTGKRSRTLNDTQQNNTHSRIASSCARVWGSVEPRWRARYWSGLVSFHARGPPRGVWDFPTTSDRLVNLSITFNAYYRSFK